MLKDKGYGPHLYKKSTQSSERYQLSKLSKKSVITGRYNPLEEVLT